MQRVTGIALLTFINVITSLGTLVVLFLVFSFASFGSEPEGQEWVALSVIMGIILLVDIFKWIGHVQVAFKFRNAWFICFLVYNLLIIIIAYLSTFYLLLLIVLFYIISAILLYSNKKNVTQVTEEVYPREKRTDKYLFVATSILIIPTLYQSYIIIQSISELVRYPILLSASFYIYDFIFGVLTIGLSWYALFELKYDLHSKWIHIFVVIFFIRSLEMIVFIILSEQSYVLSAGSPWFMLISVFTLTCYIVGYLLFVMRKDKLES